MRISQLSDELGVATVTLRRDLAQMEREGLLVRVHGGAVPLRPARAPRRGEAGSIAVLVPSLAYYWPGVLRGHRDGRSTAGLRGHPARRLLRAAGRAPRARAPAAQRGRERAHRRPEHRHRARADVIRWLTDSGCRASSSSATRLVEPEGMPVESVTTDHALGAVLAARHLAELGHRKVGLILSRYSPTSRQIAAGWQAPASRSA